MRIVERRAFLTLAGGAAVLPRFAIAQADTRPEIVIAVQALVTSNTLDPVAEQGDQLDDRPARHAQAVEAGVDPLGEVLG